MRNLWRLVTTFAFGGLLGMALGIGIGFFVFPFVFPPPEASETLSTSATSRPVATGTFVHANPNDPIHYGSGRVSVYEDTVFLEPDFEVGPGPAYRVYLVAKAEIRRSADVGDADFVDLGQLRAFKGSQNYPVPDTVDLADYPSVVIWCEAFSVLISPADLRFAS